MFNELLVQYPVRGRMKPGQVVPDNMVVICEKPIKAITCFNVSLEAAPPFWVLEYVSRSNERNDYEENFDKYEKQLKVPYYLMFHPEDQELTLYHYKSKRYSAVRPNEQDRFAIPELDLELGLKDGWVRFWYFGKLLPLPADLQNDLDEARRQIGDLQRRLAEAERELADLRRQSPAPPPRRNHGKSGGLNK
ncbi:MAG TPA: Uma2 family endonuclease [Pirellulales bacterium]|nr:Uma2 family endonuclease [Pirellulales bacterium]